MGGEEMTHACGFGLEVVLGVRVGADNDGDAILDDNVEGAESLDLAWIIRLPITARSKNSDYLPPSTCFLFLAGDYVCAFTTKYKEERSNAQ